MARKFLLGLLVPCVGLSLQVNAITLKDAVETTFSMSPDLFIETTNRRIIDHELKESYAGFLPTVDLAIGYGREYSKNGTTRALINRDDITLTRREGSLTLSQLLFDGWGTQHEVCRNQHRVFSASHRVHGTAEDVALRATEAYLDVLKRQELVNIAQQNLAAHQKVFNQIRQRSESGVGRRADLDQAQSRLSLSRTNLIAEQANLRDAKTSYMRVVGDAPINLAPVSSPLHAIPSTEDASISIALSSNPILHAAMDDLDSARSQYGVAKSRFWPDFRLEAGVSRNKNLDGSKGVNNDLYTMVRMRYNLFRGGADVNRKRSRAWEVQKAAETRNRTRRQVEESTRLDWSTYITSRAQQEHYRHYVESSRNTRDAYQKQFEIGQRTLLDLLDSENEYFAAQNSYVDAKFTTLTGQFRVLNSMGHILNYLGIEPPAEAHIKATGLFTGVDRLPPNPHA